MIKKNKGEVEYNKETKRGDILIKLNF